MIGIVIVPGVANTLGSTTVTAAGVLVAVAVAVAVAVGVSVGVSVAVAVGVSVAVAVGVGVSVAVFVGVFVDVFVGVLVGVSVGVFVGVLHALSITSENARAEPVSTAALSLMLIVQFPIGFCPSNALIALFGENVPIGNAAPVPAPH